MRVFSCKLRWQRRPREGRVGEEEEGAGRFRRYGEQDRRNGEEEETREELPTLVAAIYDGEIITALMIIKLFGK